jgi:hypothetical protein
VGYFKLSLDVLNEKSVDIPFHAARSEIYLSSVITGFSRGLGI